MKEINIRDILSLAISDKRVTRLEAQVLLAYVLDVSRVYLQAWPEKIITTEQKERFESLIIRRSRGEPLAYLTGMKEFWSLSLVVSKDVLIPRPETECLVQLVLDKVKLADQNIQLLDLGTGSGAIALALGKERPQWHIVAIDKSIAALEIARLNAKNLAISNVDFIQSDWFTHFTSSDMLFHIIVGNPPYIHPNDIHLKDDIRYEPQAALVSLPDGLQDLQKIITTAPRYLASKGWLFLEHGFDQADIVKKSMESAGFVQIEGHKDLSGLDRLTIGRTP